MSLNRQYIKRLRAQKIKQQNYTEAFRTPKIYFSCFYKAPTIHHGRVGDINEKYDRKTIDGRILVLC
ncbi:hypothetical protein DQ184_13245 [Enterococcus faecium]|nr:hypothetical protein [Enterococcus faecium]PQE45334.1 hypothetical protein CUS11_10590 [Enterococcus faecium]